MNNHYCYIIAVLAYVILRVGTVEAIECYTCKSENDPGCDSIPPDVQYLKNCSTIKEGPKYIACRKIENWVDFSVLEQKPMKRIIRQCAVDVDRERPCYYRAGFGGRGNVCDCFEDRCNSASLPISSVITLGVTLVIFLKSIA